MEPAADRREHGHGRHGPVDPRHPAAMEPAVERREHALGDPPWDYSGLPQWSPPFERREYLQYMASEWLAVVSPQWSPPFNGGSTRNHRPALTVGAGPQWSPPFNGGSTAPRIRAVWPA